MASASRSPGPASSSRGDSCRRVRRRMRSRFWLLPLGLALGGLPDWIYEVLNYPSARLMLSGSGSLPAESLGYRASEVFGPIALELFGVAARDGFAISRTIQVVVMALAAMS